MARNSRRPDQGEQGWQKTGYRMEDAPCNHAMPVNDQNDTGFVQSERGGDWQMDPFADNAVDEGLRSERSQNLDVRDSDFWSGPDRDNIERGGKHKDISLEKVKKKRTVNQRVLIGLVATILILLAVAAALVMLIPRIKTIAVEGNTGYTAEEICRIAGVRTGDNLLFLNEKDIETRINSDRYLIFVRVEKQLPDRLTLVVKERTQFAWLRWNGITYVMDARGMVLEESGDMEAIPAMMKMSGVSVTRCTVGKQLEVSRSGELEFYRSLCTELKAMKLIDLVQECDVIDMDAIRLRVQGADNRDYFWVRLGDTGSLHARLRAMTMVRDVLLEGGVDGCPVAVTDGEGRRNMGTIDVSDQKNPTYTPPQ
ncbi:MAG: FtsQ-type POTRA domain-containing protein [Clostridia bacterium]|nr:FtsQ-type POTRA domain-containing protein [Clostridia bacterium]